MSDVLRTIEVTRVGPRGTVVDQDSAATEEPMQVRLGGEPFAVIMRTPGADQELAAGFLFSERVVRSTDEIGLIRHCLDPEQPDLQNVVDVQLDGVDLAERIGERRRVVSNTSCGLCGRVTLESLEVEAPRVDAALDISRETIAELPRRLRAAQVIFDGTGGLHAAGLFDDKGNLLDIAEDVGRHNAVDKVIGRMLLTDRIPLSSTVLFVSGRTSFEIVQKAFLAGIPVLAAVSAPSSLAVELANQAGLTLVGFVRGETLNVYSHARRIR